MSKSKKLLFHVVVSIIGLILGLWFAFSVRRSETEIVNGFPLPWAAWQKVGERWMDFVSPLSPVLFAVDVILGIGLAYAVLMLGRWLVRRRSSAAITPE